MIAVHVAGGPINEHREAGFPVSDINAAANCLRAVWIEGDGVMSRRLFNDVCERHFVAPDYMQTVFEGMSGFTVQRQHDHHSPREADRFVFTIYSEARG